MQKVIIGFMALTSFTALHSQQSSIPGATEEVNQPVLQKNIRPVQNLFIITIDGFRWEELFNGADAWLLNNEKFTPENEMIRSIYWAPTAEERRKKLMPFLWNVIGVNGQVYGNRNFDNKVDVSNDYLKSYPGYSEIFTGFANPDIISNKKIANPNINILEHLNSLPGFKDKVIAFTSWDVFPYILNEMRSGLLVNSGYDSLDNNDLTEEETLLNKVSQEGIEEKTSTRYDQLTFIMAKDYIRLHHPRVVFLGLGETDEFAHQERYDLYLSQANQTDKMLADLWHWVQTTPGYANNTTFLITTDHGRGKKKKWTSHGTFIAGSSNTWIAIMGPGVQAKGEAKGYLQLYQQQLAQTIAHLLGEEFININDSLPPLF
ncbi:MAG: hypothetical protein U0U70_10245 [Chitinophagaceae bacterium]